MIVIMTMSLMMMVMMTMMMTVMIIMIMMLMTMVMMVITMLMIMKMVTIIVRITMTTFPSGKNTSADLVGVGVRCHHTKAPRPYLGFVQRFSLSWPF